MIVKRQWIDWRTLVRLGYPYSRQHTYRLMAAGRFPSGVLPPNAEWGLSAL